MVTALGIVSNLEIQNIDVIDKASYTGNVILEKFDIGTLFDQKELGTVSLNFDVDGNGQNFLIPLLATLVK
jgi:hypothetical protein